MDYETHFLVMSLWFKFRTDVSWSGTRCLIAAQPLIKGGSETRNIVVFATKATTESTTVIINPVYYFNETGANYISYGREIVAPQTWHNLICVPAEIDGANSCNYDGGGLTEEEYEPLGGIASVSEYPAVELGQTLGYAQGAPTPWFFDAAIADFAEVYIHKGEPGVFDIADFKSKIYTPQGNPKSLGSNGELPLSAVPMVYLKTWPGSSTIVNSGAGGNFTVSGGSLTARTGPTQWGQP